MPLARASFCLTFDDSFLPPAHHGSDEQISGLIEQIPRPGQSDQWAAALLIERSA